MGSPCPLFLDEGIFVTAPGHTIQGGPKVYPVLFLG